MPHTPCRCDHCKLDAYIEWLETDPDLDLLSEEANWAEFEEQIWPAIDGDNDKQRQPASGYAGQPSSTGDKMHIDDQLAQFVAIAHQLIGYAERELGWTQQETRGLALATHAADRINQERQTHAHR